MEISIENAGPFNSVRLYGQLDSKGAGSIYDTIVGLGSLGPGKVIVNVGSVTRVTRAGCSALIVAAKLFHTRTGERLHIYEASPAFISVLEGSGCDHFVQIHSTPHFGISFAA